MTESLKQRIQTGILIGIPILILLFWNDMTRTIFLVLLIALTATEYLSIFKKPWNQNLGIVLVSLLLTASLTFAAYKGFVPIEALVLLATLSGLLYVLDLLFWNMSILRSLPLINSVLYTSLPLSCLLFLHTEPYFRALVIGTIILIWVSDMGAYFVGKSIGKHKLMPSISPGKTREGFFGAGMCTMLASYIIYSAFGQFSFQTWALIGLSVWLFGSVGDLVESKMKRQLGIKDSSNILPGHGGFLDRFDGFYFCLPFVVLAIILTH